MKPPFLPMLAKDAPGKTSVLPRGEFSMEPKFDGWRWIVHVTDAGVLCWSGRNGVQRRAPGIEQELLWLNRDTVLDGELIVAGSNGVSAGGLGSSSVGHELAHGGEVEYVVFDILRLAGTDVIHEPWTYRRRLLEKMGKAFDGPYVRISEAYPVDTGVHERWLAEGLEGSIVKALNGVYSPGRRSDAFTKYKPQTTDEAVVIGFIAGKGGITGQVGAFEVRLLTNGVRTTVGVPPKLRREVTERGADEWLGHVIEFAHHGLRDDSGSPRHPVFRQRRDDRREDR